MPGTVKQHLIQAVCRIVMSNQSISDDILLADNNISLEEHITYQSARPCVLDEARGLYSINFDQSLYRT